MTMDELKLKDFHYKSTNIIGKVSDYIFLSQQLVLLKEELEIIKNETIYNNDPQYLFRIESWKKGNSQIICNRKIIIPYLINGYYIEIEKTEQKINQLKRELEELGVVSDYETK